MYILFVITIFIYIKSQIFIKAIRGIWKKKNNQDHRALKNSWIKKNFLITSKVLNAAMDINKYKIGQTMPNTYPGGFKSDLTRFTYQISNDCDEA